MAKKNFLASSFYDHEFERIRRSSKSLSRWKWGPLSRFGTGTLVFGVEPHRSWLWADYGTMWGVMLWTMPVGMAVKAWTENGPPEQRTLPAVASLWAFVAYVLFLFIRRLWAAFGKIGDEDLLKLDAAARSHPELLPMMVEEAGKDGVLRVRAGEFFLAAATSLDTARALDQEVQGLCVTLSKPLPAALSLGAMWDFKSQLRTERAVLENSASRAQSAAARASSPLVQAIEMESKIRQEKAALESVLPSAANPVFPSSRL
jgi:hypothetical protein